ncbi:MAG: hypothetical protein MUC41_09770 [Syntrophobacteraceae bacterium]|nr:hypothetical protein [Syntrophobacteraceae bacterium]
MKKTVPRQLTWLPRRAIRDHCLWCCENRRMEVATCSSERCPLFPFRFGEAGRGGDDLHAVIRRKCLDCVAGSRSEVQNCPSVGCALWCFRMGRSSQLL